MATVKAAYRLTVYKPRSVSSAENVALVPTGASPSHSDPFQVASITGVASFQPYLDGDSVKARGGSLNGLTCHTDVGELTAIIQDQRTTAGGSNLIRWLTEFFGDAKGVRQLEGCKALVERSLDGGATWGANFTGRIYVAKGNTLFRIAVVIRDMRAEKMKLFTGKPHSSISYAAPMTQCPVGTSVAYGKITATNRLTGTVRTFNFTQAAASTYHGIVLDQASVRRLDNYVTNGVAAQLYGLRSDNATVAIGSTSVTSITVKPMFDNRLRCRVRNIGAGTEGSFRVGAITQTDPYSVSNPGDASITGIVLSPLDTTDPDYLALPADGTAVNGYLYIDDLASPDNPLLIGDVAIATLKKDILDGKFSRLYPAKKPEETATAFALPSGKSIGDPIYGFAHQDADVGSVVGFTNLAADATLPTVRFMITKAEDIWKFCEENLDRPYRLADRLTSDGKIQPLDLRLPTSAPATTIADADLVALPKDWTPDPAAAVARVDAKFYAELPSFFYTSSRIRNGRPPDARGHEMAPMKAVDAFTAGEIPVTILDLGAVDIGDNAFSVDYLGLRAQPGESINGVDRRHWCKTIIEGMSNNLRSPYGRGPMYVSLEGRNQSSNLSDCQAGDLRLVAVSSIPDPSTNRRGGTRVMRCVEWREDRLKRTLKMLDLGISTVATAPTVGTPTQNSPDTEHAIDVVVTVNASTEAAVLWVNCTATSVGARPADSDANWFYAGRATATGTITVRNLPSNKRAWVRVRTEPAALAGQYQKLASAWAYPAGTGYVATSAITAPSATSETSVTGRRFVGNWTVGNAYCAVKVYLALSGATLEHIATLPPGSTSYEFNGLDLTTAYDWGVSHDDGMGGESSVATDSRTTSGTAATCPAAGVFLLLAGTP